MDYSLLLGIKQRSYSVNSKPASPHLELHTAQTGGGGTGRQEQPFFREDEGGINACLVVGPGTYYLVGKSPLAVLLPSFQLACSLAHACLRALLLPNKRTE